MRRGLCWLCLGLLLSCATKSRGPSEATPAPARIKDSPPEKRAALRAADPNIGAEADEQRWGFDAARERKRKETEEKKGTGRASPPATAPTPTGPFDIRPTAKTATDAKP